MRRDDGSAAVVVVALLPLLLTLLLGVLQVGALRVLAARAASAADLATLAAVDDQDEIALVDRGVLRLSPDAERVAREFFALNLERIADHLAATPAAVARGADVAIFHDVPAVDALTGWRYERPTIRLAAAVPLRAPGPATPLLPRTIVVNVRAASAPR